MVDHVRRVDSLRRLMRLLDEVFRIPGTSIRFGWDPILGLVPWAGDLLTALISIAIVAQAHQMRVPRIVQLRMLLNIAIDLLVGIVPFLGDVADVFWKANTKNFGLLERHAGEVRPATAGDWLFVAGVVGVVLAMALALLGMVYWMLRLIGRGLF